MPFNYVELACDICEEEIQGGRGGPGPAEFAFLKRGALVCKACGESRADRVIMWFLVEPEPGDLEEPDEPVAIPAKITIEELPEEEPEA